MKLRDLKYLILKQEILKMEQQIPKGFVWFVNRKLSDFNRFVLEMIRLI